MSKKSQDVVEEHPGKRYRVYTTPEDDCVIYDTKEPTAWIKSKSFKTLESWR